MNKMENESRQRLNLSGHVVITIMSLRIRFCHHLSLSYWGGGEKWIVNIAKELAKKGHDVEIYALPILLEGRRKINPKDVLDGIPYCEKMHHKVSGDVVYVTYNPLSWLNFQTSKPRIGGIHSQAFWVSPNVRYGLFPNLANIANRFTGYFELRHFNAIHTVTEAFPINHPRVYFIPNFVDATIYKPSCEKDENFTVAFSSRQIWQKGYDLFQQTIGLLKQEIPIKTNISGGIPERNMPDFLSSSHVSLLPSRVDTFGLSIVESSMCETPVITTPISAHQRLELPLTYGKSIDDFKTSVLNFYEMWKQNREQFWKLAKDCRIQALKFDKREIVKKVLRMFEEVNNTT